MLEIGQIRKQITALDKGDDASRREAIQALRQYEQKDWAEAPAPLVQTVVESLVEQLPNGTKPPFMLKELGAIFGNIGPRSKSAVPRLVENLQDGNADSIREMAAVALGKIGKDAKVAVDQLIVLTSARNTLATHAVHALGCIGCSDQRVKTALVNLWASPLLTQNGQVQVALALCKLKIDARGLLEILMVTLTGSQDVALRKSSAEALGWCNKNDTDVVPVLLSASLSDKHEEVRQWAQAALDQLGLSQESAIQICAKQLKESKFAEAALRKCGAPAVPALIKALTSTESMVRIKAARTLASLGELAAGAIPALTTALNDREPDVRLAAAKGLWNAGKNADNVVPVLVKLLDEEPDQKFEDGEMRRQFLQTVMEALWRIGPPAIAARPALMARTKDKNRMISESAKSALKKIAGA